MPDLLLLNINTLKSWVLRVLIKKGFNKTEMHSGKLLVN